MNVRELLTVGGYGVKSYPPFCEKHVEISKRFYKEGEKHSFILTEEEAIEQFGDSKVWLAFHSEGTYDKPVDGEHVFCICIE